MARPVLALRRGRGGDADPPRRDRRGLRGRRSSASPVEPRGGFQGAACESRTTSRSSLHHDRQARGRLDWSAARAAPRSAASRWTTSSTGSAGDSAEGSSTASPPRASGGRSTSTATARTPPPRRASARVPRARTPQRARPARRRGGRATAARGSPGIPFTSERQLTGAGPAEATATIVRRTLAELELDALCWNVVPTHPGTETSNRRPTGDEVDASRPFLEELASGAGSWPSAGSRPATGAPYVRHPAHGGAAGFRAGLLRIRRRRSAQRRLFRDEDLQRQAGRDRARLVPRRRRGPDARPPRDADRRHAARQGQARSTRRTSTPATSSSS